jgi:hypothetical protein
VVKSDSAISAPVRDALRSYVRVLEDVPDHQKDWHPGSDQKVLDLVHPSLFPLVYGLSRVIPSERIALGNSIQFIGKGSIVEDFDPNDVKSAANQSYTGGISERLKLWGSYQWLPSEIQLTSDGAKITSYINNLHPQRHKLLYEVLEKILTATVPLWEECLAGYYDRRRIKVIRSGTEDWRIEKGAKYQIPGRTGPESLVDARTWTPDNLDRSTGDFWDVYEDFYEWQKQHRILIHREPGDYISQEALKREYLSKAKEPSTKFREKFPEGLQVIFKLANIHLTPEKPEYSGGTWHVEGALNEMICASAIYYFDQENITNSYLAFRHELDEVELISIPEQNEHDSLEAFLGVEYNGKALQRIGQVLTKQNRLLVFPNSLHHQVQPLRLLDETKPGHRKILAMFLVDPHRPILSTAHVPPQREDWLNEELCGSRPVSEIPNEASTQAVHSAKDFPMSWEQAVDIRAKLMKERGGINKDFEEILNSTMVSLIT